MNIIKVLAALIMGMTIQPVIPQESEVEKASAYKAYEDDHFMFVYGMKDTLEWNMFFDLVYPFNKELVKTAQALLLVVATDSHNSFSWEDLEKLALNSGCKIRRIDGFDYTPNMVDGFIAKGVLGFDYDKARRVLGIPPEYIPCVMVAVEK